MDAPFEFEDSRTSWRSLALSGAFHGALFTAFLFFWRVDSVARLDDRPRAVNLVLADVSNDDATEYYERLPAIAEKSATNAIDVGDVLPISQPAPSVAQLDTLESVATIGDPNLDAGAMTQPTGNSGFALGGGGQLTADELKQIAAERQHLASLLPRGEPATIGVFGSGGLTGRKFVFVIDRSKSMGDEGLGVLARANAELQTALSRLTADHEFQVVAYNHETTTVERRALLPATVESRQKVTEFIQNLASFGGTEHESALIAALAFKPDIIVLMTDGGLPEMNEAQLATIRRIAGKKIQVHCIQFGLGPATTESFLIDLAEQNGGSYKYVDVATWK